MLVSSVWWFVQICVIVWWPASGSHWFCVFFLEVLVRTAPKQEEMNCFPITTTTFNQCRAKKYKNVLHDWIANSLATQHKCTLQFGHQSTQTQVRRYKFWAWLLDSHLLQLAGLGLINLGVQHGVGQIAGSMVSNQHAQKIWKTSCHKSCKETCVIAQFGDNSCEVFIVGSMKQMGHNVLWPMSNTIVTWGSSTNLLQEVHNRRFRVRRKDPTSSLSHFSNQWQFQCLVWFELCHNCCDCPF